MCKVLTVAQMDGVTSYIEWAHHNDFGIIDTNIPHYITHPEDTDPYIQGADERTLGIQMKELMNYIWDNYLQLWEAEDIFLLGVGNAYLGVKLLLTERRKSPLGAKEGEVKEHSMPTNG